MTATNRWGIPLALTVILTLPAAGQEPFGQPRDPPSPEPRPEPAPAPAEPAPADHEIPGLGKDLFRGNLFDQAPGPPVPGLTWLPVHPDFMEKRLEELLALLGIQLQLGIPPQMVRDYMLLELASRKFELDKEIEELEREYREEFGEDADPSDHVGIRERRREIEDLERRLEREVGLLPPRPDHPPSEEPPAGDPPVEPPEAMVEPTRRELLLRRIDIEFRLDNLIEKIREEFPEADPEEWERVREKRRQILELRELIDRLPPGGGGGG